MTKVTKIISATMLALTIAFSPIIITGCGDTDRTDNSVKNSDTSSKSEETKKEVVSSKAPEPEKITLTNPVIEEYVRRVFEIGDGVITTKDAARVRGISISGYAGTDFSDLALFPNLGGVDITNSTISDLSLITKHCKNLSSFAMLGGNDAITDLSPIAACETMEFFTLSKEKLTDLSSLSTSKSIRSIKIIETDIKDYSFLKDIKSINQIVLRKAGEIDTKNLANLSELMEFDAREMKLVASDLSFAAGENLGTIIINRCGFSDISGLPTSSMTVLSKLDLSGNGIKDITVLGDLASIRTLILSNNDITDISALAKIKDKIGDRIELGHNKNLKDLSGLDEYVSAFW